MEKLKFKIYLVMALIVLHAGITAFVWIVTGNADIKVFGSMELLILLLVRIICSVGVIAWFILRFRR